MINNAAERTFFFPSDIRMPLLNKVRESAKNGYRSYFAETPGKKLRNF